MSVRARFAVFACLPLVGCIGPLDDLDHTREPAIVTSLLTVESEEVLLHFVAVGSTWDGDPTAACEMPFSHEKESADDIGSFHFVMAAHSADPVAFGMQHDEVTGAAPRTKLGLHARGVDWTPSESCSVRLLERDYDERSFSFRVEDCTFHHDGSPDIRVTGEMHTARCFDPEAPSLVTLGHSLAASTYDLGQAFAKDPKGFATSIALLPLFLAGAH